MELAAAVIGLSGKAVIIANDLYELHGKFKDAGSTIDAVCHEVEVIRASLARVQRLLEKDCAQGIEFSDDLRDIFNMAIAGCTVVLSCLDDEIKNLLSGSKHEGNGGIGWKVKAKYLWKEETMMDLLQKLRGQQGAISLLFQSLQMESLSELHHLLRDRSAEMQRSQAATDIVRQTYPEVNVPESTFNDLDSETDSVISTTEFAFDDEIINSKAYRRALSAAYWRHRTKPPSLDSIPENGHHGSISDPTDTKDREDQSEQPSADTESRPTPETTSTTFADPLPAYEPPLPPPIDTAPTSSDQPEYTPRTPSLSSPLSATLPSSSTSSSSSSAPTPTTPHFEPDLDPLTAAISKSLASFRLRAPEAPTTRVPQPNRPPIPLAPRLDADQSARGRDGDGRDVGEAPPPSSPSAAARSASRKERREKAAAARARKWEEKKKRRRRRRGKAERGARGVVVGEGGYGLRFGC